MLEAFHTLEHEITAELSEAIHDYGHELTDLSDIKAARITYGSLSDAFSQFATATGVPANYENQSTATCAAWLRMFRKVVSGYRWA